MAFDLYTMEQLARLRLEDARRHAAQQALAFGAADPSRRLRFRIGLALIRAGQRLAGRPRPAPRMA
jgi:hypothetical protein